jgi:nicotinate-nucleotide adenylyltransferase
MHRANWHLTTGNCFFMNVAIFGGTFDPVHRGHLAVARAAQQAYKLGRIYFVPADIPPHKQRQPVTPFYHRYAMLALALRGAPAFLPSLIESRLRAPGPGRQRPNYSIDTVRRFRKTMKKSDRLFFILGIDMFQNIATWHKPDELMKEVEFIVVSRPGYGKVAGPWSLVSGKDRNSPPRTRRNTKEGVPKIHWLTGVAEDVSSTQARKALSSGRAAKGLLDEAVVEYIRKEHLYVRK